MHTLLPSKSLKTIGARVCVYCVAQRNANAGERWQFALLKIALFIDFESAIICVVAVIALIMNVDDDDDWNGCSACAIATMTYWLHC